MSGQSLHKLPSDTAGIAGFPAGLRPRAAHLRLHEHLKARRVTLRSLKHGALSRIAMYDGEVATWIKRNFGETFFLGGMWIFLYLPKPYT
jgi:hypothetical protein